MSTVAEAEAGPIRTIVVRAFLRSKLEDAAQIGTAAEKSGLAKALERGNRRKLNAFIDGLCDEYAAGTGSWQDIFKFLLENLPAIIAAILALFA